VRDNRAEMIDRARGAGEAPGFADIAIAATTQRAASRSSRATRGILRRFMAGS
jgi:hypothetical protein